MLYAMPIHFEGQFSSQSRMVLSKSTLRNVGRIIITAKIQQLGIITYAGTKNVHN